MTRQNVEEIIIPLKRGVPAEAERICHQRLAGRPDDKDLLLLLTLALRQQGRHEEVLAVCERLTKLFPQEALNWGNYSTALRFVGKLSEAIEAAAIAVRLEPDNALQYVNLGLAQLQKRELAAAHETLLHAYALDSNSPKVCIPAARACHECRDYRAEEILLPWQKWMPLDDELQLELAHLKMALGDGNLAVELVEDLLQRAPENLQASVFLVNVYERVNRLDSAEALLQRVTERWPEVDREAHIETGHLRAKIAMRRGQLGEARKLLEKIGPNSGSDYNHYFALAEIYDKLKDPNAAMRALVNAHALQIEELKAAVPERFAPGAPVFASATHRTSMEEYQSWPVLRAPNAAQSPVFIVGLPRSGTTLLEQILDAHPKLQSMDERPFFYILANQLREYDLHMPQDAGRLSQRDCDELRKGYLTLACSKVPRKWDAQLVDKNPLNMLWLPVIQRLYPKAKFILALRHPCDVLLSNYMQNFRAVALGIACANLERMASTYVDAMECWSHHVGVFKPNLFVSRYEDLVANPQEQTRRIAEFLELEDAAPMLQFDRHARDKGFIATPSYTQVIEPVNRKGMGRWHRYREYFEPVLPILEPMLKHWRYSIDPAD